MGCGAGSAARYPSVRVGPASSVDFYGTSPSCGPASDTEADTGPLQSNPGCGVEEGRREVALGARGSGGHGVPVSRAPFVPGGWPRASSAAD